MLLANKTVVVTGCNRGIGREILETFSSHGAKIYACVRNLDKNFIDLIEKLKSNYKNEIIPIKLDLLNEESVKEAATNILSDKSEIDILINNAGMIHTALFQMTSIQKLKEVFQVNFFSQAIFTQYILKPMIKKKNGSIIYISSTSALDGNEGRSAYSASKAAILSQVKTLARELGVLNIRVNAIAPGLTQTDMMKNNTSDVTINKYISSTFLKKVGDPKDIAELALFLSLNKSKHISGQVIRVDGGF